MEGVPPGRHPVVWIRCDEPDRDSGDCLPSIMDWIEAKVTSWTEFTNALEPVLDAYKGHVPPVYVFRGQADASWLLEPSLLRQLRSVRGPGVARGIEELLENEFRAQASLFPETESVWLALLAAGRTELWAYMQHHGCPTRLLDWTASAYVAAYFAVEQLPERDGAIFVVGAAALEQYVARCNPQLAEVTDDRLIDPSTPERVLFTWPHFRSRRVVAQQGHFSVSTNILSAHDRFILEACSSVAAERPAEIIHQKIVIPADLKLVILQQLRAMNIAPHALFPTLDGLGKSLSDLARLRAAIIGGTG